MLGQEQCVLFGLETRPKGTRLFGVMSGPCWAYVGLLGAMLGPCWAYVGLMLGQERRVHVRIVPLFLVGLLALNLFKGLGNLEVILLNFTRVNASTRSTYKQQALKKGSPF